MENDSVAVVYICWMPYGLECFKDFLVSYKQFNSGLSHDLIIIFKGDLDLQPFLQLPKNYDVSFRPLHYTKGGLDIATYYWCANQIDHSYIFFLNSRSRILKENWLLNFYSLSRLHPEIIFASTGSWQSYSSSVFTNNKWTYEKKKSFLENFNKYKLLIKAATLWWFYFPLFPNPHIRTNAFFISRAIFLSLRVKPIVSKIDAYRFESGRNGFSKQLKKLGFRLTLLGSNGNIFQENDWKESNIFWSSNQENLLIADNQTDEYLNADSKRKYLLNLLAWGKR